LRVLLTPKWILAHIVVLVVSVAFVSLGMWQLRRLDERRLMNAVGEARFEAEPVDALVLVSAAGGDLDSLDHYRAVATGTFVPESEVLIRSQVYRDVAGFDVITPLVAEDGTAVLVNRGWVPLEMDQVPVAQAPPPAGVVTVEGWLAPTQERKALGPTDPETGDLTTMSRVDIDRIQEQVPFPLLPVYLVEMGERGVDLPVPRVEPTFDDEGPHLAYAIQWFAFLAIGLIGYGFLIRRSLQGSGGSGNEGQVLDD
jgi:surfeit locus 1 family protein